MSENHFTTGHCLCGNISYTISAPPLRMEQCHCEDCRRSTGTGHASNAFFKKEAVNIQGETNSFNSISDTGSTITRYFCPNCGSRLFGSSSLFPEIISVSAGTLDDSSWFKPTAIVYTKSKPVWDLIDETIPAFEEMPPPKTS